MNSIRLNVNRVKNQVLCNNGYEVITTQTHAIHTSQKSQQNNERIESLGKKVVN